MFTLLVIIIRYFCNEEFWSSDESVCQIGGKGGE